MRGWKLLPLLCLQAGAALAADTISPSFQGSSGSGGMSAGVHQMAFSAPQLTASSILSGVHALQSGFFAFLQGMPTAAADTIGSGGGAISFAAPSGSVTVIIPPLAFSGAVGVTLQTPSSFPSSSPSANLTGSGVGVEILLDQAVQPKVDVMLTLTYQAADVAGLDTSRLILARYDTTRNVWVPLVSTADTLSRQVTGRTNHFSVFQIMQAAASSTVDTVLAFPNPLRPSQGHTSMTFANLPAEARIRIYTLTGQLVRDFSANAVGMGSWDGRNQSGEKTASGTYVVFAQGAGQKKTFKVIVQR